MLRCTEQVKIPMVTSGIAAGLNAVLNYIFIFEYDVLRGYGLTGLVMCAVFAASPRVQAIVAAVGI